MDIAIKKQMIYESFDILKDSWSSKDEALKRLICKMYEIEPQTALDMWIYLLNKNEDLLLDWHASGLIEDMVASIVHGVNHSCYFFSFDNEREIELSGLLFGKRELYSFVYGKNACLDKHCGGLLSHLIITNDTEKLNEILILMQNNYEAEKSMGKVLTIAIEHIDGCTIPKQNIELMEDVVSQIEDKMLRAEAFSALLSIDE